MTYLRQGTIYLSLLSLVINKNIKHTVSPWLVWLIGVCSPLYSKFLAWCLQEVNNCVKLISETFRRDFVWLRIFKISLAS